MFNQSFSSVSVDLERFNAMIRHHKGGQLKDSYCYSKKRSIRNGLKINVFNSFFWIKFLIVSATFIFFCYLTKRLFGR